MGVLPIVVVYIWLIAWKINNLSSDIMFWKQQIKQHSWLAIQSEAANEETKGLCAPHEWKDARTGGIPQSREKMGPGLPWENILQKKNDEIS